MAKKLARKAEEGRKTELEAKRNELLAALAVAEQLSGVITDLPADPAVRQRPLAEAEAIQMMQEIYFDLEQGETARQLAVLQKKIRAEEQAGNLGGFLPPIERHTAVLCTWNALLNGNMEVAGSKAP